MHEINKNNLQSWEQEDSEVVYDGGKPYRLLRFGALEYADKMPESNAGIDKLHVRTNPPGFSYVTTEKGRQFVWKRLYWHNDQKKWLEVHPAKSLFSKEQRQVDNFLRELTKAYGVPYRIPIILFSLKSSRNEQSNSKLLTELNQLIEKVATPWGGRIILSNIYTIERALPRASINEKVSLAIQRRDLLAQVVSILDR